MNTIDYIIKSYSRLYNSDILPFWFLTPIRRAVRIVANNRIPHLLSKHKYLIKKEVDVIVSFTSYPARIDNVWQVVECMFRQTYLPKQIILWLSEDQFNSFEELPLSLRSRIGKRFIIRFVKGDIRSHKKYYYVSQEYPNSLIFLIDDDLYYPSDILERTYEKYVNNTDCIVGNYGYEITYNINGKFKSYSEWRAVKGNYEGASCFIGSGGGTLFKPNVMYKDFLNIELARSLTPQADDIWINAMADMNNLPKYIINAGLVLDIHSNNDVPLYKTNVGLGGNDKQLQGICEYYKGYKLFEKK